MAISELSGKIQLAFAVMSLMKARDYDTIKATLLARYDVNKETYHWQFYSAMKHWDETYWELSIGLLDLLNK